MNIILLYFSIKYKGDWNKIYNALEIKEKISIEEIRKVENKIKKENIKFFTILDRWYPDSFKNTYKPPFVIYYKGKIELLKNNDIYFVTGDLNKSENTKNHLNLLFPQLLKTNNILNSLHKGVEELVYEYTMEENNTIFVSANSINNPDCAFNIIDVNLNENLIISEYYDNEHVTKNSLRARNRLLVAMAKAIILVSSNKKSWTNNLVTHALNVGKEIYCMQDECGKLSGNTELIKQGAHLLTSITDITNNKDNIYKFK